MTVADQQCMVLENRAGRLDRNDPARVYDQIDRGGVVIHRWRYLVHRLWERPHGRPGSITDSLRLGPAAAGQRVPERIPICPQSLDWWYDSSFPRDPLGCLWGCL